YCPDMAAKKVRRYIHMFVKNPDYFHTFVTRELIVDCVAYNGEILIARSNLIAGASKIWIFS
ncbi:MAG: hypothetical protein ABW124_22660, partial [Candidatus Thiodiazotropha sp. 6PLUC9]